MHCRHNSQRRHSWHNIQSRDSGHNWQNWQIKSYISRQIYQEGHVMSNISRVVCKEWQGVCEEGWVKSDTHRLAKSKVFAKFWLAIIIYEQ